MAALSMSPQTTAVQHRESDMPQLFNNTPTRRLSTTNEKRRLPSLETLINKKLPPLPLSVTLTPSTSVLTPPMKRTNSGCSDVSSIVSNARRNSIDPVDGIADLAELSDIEDGFLRAVSLDMIPEVKRYLLDKVDINIKNGFKRDAMQIAARNGSINMLDLLSQCGGSIETRGLKGDTLYHLAASNGHLDVVKWLLKNGLVDAPDLYGNTAVHIAARRYEIDTLKFFDAIMGCDFRFKNLDGQTPYDCIPRVGEDPDKLARCREVVKAIVVEAERQEKEEKMAVIKRRVSLAPLTAIVF